MQQGYDILGSDFCTAVFFEGVCGGKQLFIGGRAAKAAFFLYGQGTGIGFLLVGDGDFRGSGFFRGDDPGFFADGRDRWFAAGKSKVQIRVFCGKLSVCGKEIGQVKASACFDGDFPAGQRSRRGSPALGKRCPPSGAGGLGIRLPFSKIFINILACCRIKDK
ncbi:MAG: hypothetical protein Q4F41_13875 [Eubacteriales bacterium]|nr:hypothetical protein [Eubacteriales bacterium]